MTKLKREVPRFIFAGICAVGTDLGSYYLLLKIINHSPAKAISFICGSIVAYIINKHWTFQQKRKSYSEMMRFAFLYSITLGTNVGVNKISLLILPDWVFIAFLVATGTSTILNFIGQKWWVFK